ncbi:MAG: hypothetical protein AABZ15_05005 [Nitrospirota bacterium]
MKKLIAFIVFSSVSCVVASVSVLWERVRRFVRDISIAGQIKKNGMARYEAPHAVAIAFILAGLAAAREQRGDDTEQAGGEAGEVPRGSANCMICYCQWIR